MAYDPNSANSTQVLNAISAAIAALGLGTASTHPASDFATPTDVNNAISALSSVYATPASVTSAINAALASAFPARTQTSTTRSFATSTTDTSHSFQVSTSRDSVVFYGVSVNTTATIGGAAQGDIYLEICSTNSSTATDWGACGSVGNGQTVTLAVALQSVQKISGQLMAYVPAGYWVRLRPATTNGSPTYNFNSGREVLL